MTIYTVGRLKMVEKLTLWKRAMGGIVCSYPENIFEIKELKFAISKLKVCKSYFQNKIKVYVCGKDIGKIEFECRTIDYLNNCKDLDL